MAQKEITYGGMTTHPDKYTCTDGDMRLAVNTEMRNGAYTRASLPSTHTFYKEGFIPLFVHTPPSLGEEIFVGVNENGSYDFMVSFTYQRGESSASPYYSNRIAKFSASLAGDELTVTGYEQFRANGGDSITGGTVKECSYTQNGRAYECRITVDESDAGGAYCVFVFVVDFSGGGTINSCSITSEKDGDGIAYTIKNSKLQSYTCYGVISAYRHKEDKKVPTNISTRVAMKDVELLSFCSIGNIVCISNNGEFSYLLFRERKYVVFKKIPDIPHFKFITWRCKEYYPYKDKSYNNWTNRNPSVYLCPNAIITHELETYDTFYTSNLSELSLLSEYQGSAKHKAITDAILAGINTTRSILEGRKRFMHPVFLRYALKLYDGSYIKTSAIIPLFPFDEEYCPRLFSDSGYYSGETPNKVGTFFESYFVSMFCDYLPDGLDDWDGIIESLDFFITPYLYGIDTDSLDSYVYRYSSSQIRIYPKLRYLKAEDNIKSIDNFYLVKSIPIAKVRDWYKKGNISDFASETGLLIGEEESLINFTSNTSLKEHSLANSEMQVNGISSYNSRLLAADVKRMFAVGDYLNDEQVTFYSATITRKELESGGSARAEDAANEVITKDTETDLSKLKLKKYESEEGKEGYFSYKKVRSTGFYMIEFKNSSGEYKYLKVQENFDCLQKFVSYPDINATKIIWQDADDFDYKYFKLSPHDFLNIAYSYNPTVLVWDKSETDIPQVTEGNYIHTANIVKCSDANNPFVFKDGNSAVCGGGKILALATNSLPVSTGQFGAYPIFAFCTDGVFAISVSDTGTLQSVTPYSPDIITDSKSVANMGRAIVFISKNGVLTFGGQEDGLLLPADKTADYKWDSIPNGEQSTFIKNHFPDMPEMTDLYTYLVSGAKVAYDYVHSRLIVFNPKYTYSYIYNERDKAWAIITRSFARCLNAYDKCLLVDNDGKIWDYSTDNNIEKVSGLLMSRPIKLDAPDALKTLRTIIQRGIFSKGQVTQAVYASRDGQNWVPLASSAWHYLRNVSGTGYKYFRVVVFLNDFTKDNTLSGMSVEYEPRLTNRMR